MNTTVVGASLPGPTSRGQNPEPIRGNDVQPSASVMFVSRSRNGAPGSGSPRATSTPSCGLPKGSATRTTIPASEAFALGYAALAHTCSETFGANGVKPWSPNAAPTMIRRVRRLTTRTRTLFTFEKKSRRATTREPRNQSAGFRVTSVSLP